MTSGRASQSFDPRIDGPGKTDSIVVWRDGAAVQIDARWGLKPMAETAKPISLLRSEERAIDRPCLVIANDFGLKVDGKIKYRARLATDAPFFCIAGLWRPAQPDWPLAFAALTVEAYPDIAPYKDRHVAIVREEDWQDWLTGQRSIADLLRPFPTGSFEISGVGRQAAIRDLFG